MLEREAASLYRLLVAPVEPFLDSSRLLVLEPDSTFQGLPWSVLVDSHGRYLIERFALTVSPGLNYYRGLKFRPQFHPSDHALIASAASIRSFDSKLHPLPDVVYEGESVAKYFDNPDMLSDGRVTAHEIYNHFPGAVVFHFAGHANAEIGRTGLLVESANPSEQQPLETALFSPHDAEQLDLRSLRLAVLSACSTAQNERGLSDPNSFVRVFLRAGVPHVVATQWAVDSSTAADLVDGFYENLMNGETVPRALQTTICRLRHDPSRSHPYYWAVFSAYGN
jgi:CHAT domain-containing protein